MLSVIREKSKGWIAWIIVIFISIPFALWGIQSYFETTSKVIVAEVDGMEIEGETYKEALENQRRAMQQATGGKIDPQILNSVAVKRRVLDGIMQRLLLNQDAEAWGYRISDTHLTQLIQNTSQFQRDGRFDPDLYEQTLRSAGYSPLEYEAQLRQQSVIQQIRAGFSESAFVTKLDQQRAVRQQLQQRRMSYVKVEPESFRKELTVPATQIEARYKANGDRYREPEQVRVEYIRLAVGELAKDVVVNEEEVRRAYEENLQSYTTPEARRASHILLEVAPGADPEQRVWERAQGLIKQLRDGASFAELAEQYSADVGSAKKGGDLGYLDRGIMDKSFEDALYRLQQGEISEPVRSVFGYHVIKLTGVKGGLRKPFESVRDELRKEISREKAGRRFLDLAETFSDLVYEHPDSLANAAETLDLEIKQSEWFSRKGGTGIAANPKVVATAFSEEILGQGLNSAAIELDIDTLVALRLIGHRESKIKPLEAVRDEIEKQLEAESVRKQAGETGRKILAALRQGGSLGEAAKRHGLKVRTPGLVGRRGSEGLDARVIGALFKVAPPKTGETVYGSVDLGDAGYVVFALEQVVEGDPAKAEKAVLAQVKGALQRRRGEEYYQSYQQGLRSKAEIVIHEDQL